MKHDYNQLFADLDAYGLVIDSLFQQDDNCWRCSLKSTDIIASRVRLFSYGEGPNAYYAILSGFALIQDGKAMRPWSEENEREYQASRGSSIQAQIDQTKATRLLASLGLKPKPKFTPGLL